MTARNRMRAATRPWGRMATLLAAGLMLASCSNVHDQLGFGKRPPPDEFAVAARAPLSLPPEYELRPPAPDQIPEVQDAAKVQTQAREALFGSDNVRALDAQRQATPAFERRSVGERALLTRAGVDSSNSSIRQILSRETMNASQDDNFVNDLMFWNKPEQPGVSIDAAAEAERLRKADAEGKPLAEGEIPVEKVRKEGLLDGLFQ